MIIKVNKLIMLKALVNSYRGRKNDGTFDHNYSWLEVKIILKLSLINQMLEFL
jgi:hypothetical protein